jgi:hypothetical protein
MLSALCKRRMTKLIDFMENLPKQADKHFDMGWWVTHQGDAEIDDEHGLKDGVTFGKLLSCGTAACAAGWAATVPAFRKAGFNLERGEDGRMRPSIDPGVFFDIPHPDEEGDLFGADLPLKTPKQWARHARRWMKSQDRK